MHIEILDWTLNFADIIDALVKMVLALVCGGILGMERGRKKRPAGFRTYMLVCLGATLVMMTNSYLCKNGSGVDEARLGAQVINGIGFLGAGTIITTGHNRVKGLTTGAGLWTSACIGLAIGSGFYVGAILGTLMIIIIMIVMHNLDRKLSSSTKILVLYMEFKKMSTIKRVNAYAKDHEIIIDDIEVESPDQTRSGKAAAVITLRLPSKTAHSEVIEQFEDIEGVIFAEEI